MSRRPEVFTGTAAELRAKLDQRRPFAAAIMEAMLRGDHDGCAEAQRQMRQAFPEAGIES